VILKTWTGRELRVTTEVDWAHGRAFYVIEKIGTFTIERDPYGEIDARADSLHIGYGRYSDELWFSRDPYPEAPVIFGVTLSGAIVIRDPSKYTDEPSRSHHGWHAMRAGGGEAPPATRKRTHEICCALLVHYLNRDDNPAIEHARALHHAPKRLRQRTERIGELRKQIAALQADLGVELAAADLDAALLANSNVRTA
jgi:hypothetical protein